MAGPDGEMERMPGSTGCGYLCGWVVRKVGFRQPGVRCGWCDASGGADEISMRMGGADGLMQDAGRVRMGRVWIGGPDGLVRMRAGC